MTTSQIIKENQQLKRSLDQLTSLSTDLLRESSKRGQEIERLMMQLVGADNKVVDILSLLVTKMREDDFFEIIPEGVGNNLDTIRLLVRVLLHDNESFERENEVLRRKIRELKNNTI